MNKFVWCLNSAESWGPGTDFCLESDWRPSAFEHWSHVRRRRFASGTAHGSQVEPGTCSSSSGMSCLSSCQGVQGTIFQSCEIHFEAVEEWAGRRKTCHHIPSILIHQENWGRKGEWAEVCFSWISWCDQLGVTHWGKQHSYIQAAHSPKGDCVTVWTVSHSAYPHEIGKTRAV